MVVERRGSGCCLSPSRVGCGVIRRPQLPAARRQPGSSLPPLSVRPRAGQTPGPRPGRWPPARLGPGAFPWPLSRVVQRARRSGLYPSRVRLPAAGACRRPRRQLAGHSTPTVAQRRDLREPARLRLAGACRSDHLDRLPRAAGWAAAQEPVRPELAEMRLSGRYQRPLRAARWARAEEPVRPWVAGMSRSGRCRKPLRVG